MAPSKQAAARKYKSSPKTSSTEPPAPFKRAPEVLAPLLQTLSPKHVYITHIDRQHAAFKRKIFLVPVVLNLSILAAMTWRLWYIVPWYFQFVIAALGHPNGISLPISELSWADISKVVSRRALTFLLDFLLFVFVWPWPLEFCLGGTNGSPLFWRWTVGFREQEIYVRRSRSTWDTDIRKAVKGDDKQALTLLLKHIGAATEPMLINEKTGYLTMNSEWDLDWAAMVEATKMVDEKTVALEAFRLVVVINHKDYGWVSLDMKEHDTAGDDSRRTQVFAFRDALAAVGKEDLFYRWIEIVQFESTRPGGFSPEKQVETAKQIRDLFSGQGIDFDEFWKDSVDQNAVLA
ncbi:unnamed protein product [Discula destructiva]